MIKKYLCMCLALCAVSVALWSCNEDETYADQKEKERKAIAAFLKRNLVLLDAQGDTLLNTGKIKVISEQEFLAQNSTTDLDENEYVLFANNGVYMQIVRKGTGEPIQNGETWHVDYKFYEYNIVGDSIQASNHTSDFENKPEVLDVTNNNGIVDAYFNTEHNGGGVMYMKYRNSIIPNGWRIPLNYINLGQQKSIEKEIAKVRIIVPHSEGHPDAIENVYPCFYEVAYIKTQESYAGKKEKEKKAISDFLNRDLVLLDYDGDTLLNTGKIKVISEQEFLAQNSTTNLDENEYVLFANNGVYMQIVRKGPGEPIRSGESKRVMCRYYEYNILGDSLQTSNQTPYWATNPEVLDVYNNNGTINATFNTTINGGGAMYMIYKNISVPNGWLVPLNYINLGRQKTEDEGIAKVRIIVPHSEGQTDATNNVYPCFYEITYQEMRE